MLFRSSDLMDLRKEMQTERLRQAGELARARQESLDAYRGAQGGRADRRLDQADTREARLAVNSSVRQDQAFQRLDIQRKELERKIAEGGDKTALAAWRAVADAQHKRAVEVINANSINSNLSKEDRKALIDEAGTTYRAAIEQMRVRAGGTTPSGGVTPPGQPVAPKVQIGRASCRERV